MTKNKQHNNKFSEKHFFGHFILRCIGLLISTFVFDNMGLSWVAFLKIFNFPIWAKLNIFVACRPSVL